MASTDSTSKLALSNSAAKFRLGKDGPEVSRLGIGLMTLAGGIYGPGKPDDERLRFLDAVYESGARLWDTADIYGDSEDIIGKWLKANPDKREKIVLATKFSSRVAEDGSFSTDTSPEYARAACERSLQRLGTPYIDLLYMHRVDGHTPVERSMRALARLVREGKVRHVGISECSAATLRRAHAVHPVAAYEVEYSPFALDIERPAVGVLAACRALGVAVVAYSPLGRGLLSGRYRSLDDFAPDDWRRGCPRFSPDNFGRNLALVRGINALAERKGCTPAQLTLAWLLAQGPDVVPIPGTTSAERLAENQGSLAVELTDDEKSEIRRLSEDAEVYGERYPEFAMAACFGDTPELKEGE